MGQGGDVAAHRQLGRCTYPPPQLRDRLIAARSYLVAQRGDVSSLLARCQSVECAARGGGNLCVHGAVEQRVVALPLCHLLQLLFPGMARNPRDGGFLQHDLALLARVGAHQFNLRFCLLGARPALGGTGELLHHADALHGHEVLAGAEVVIALDGNVVQAQHQARVGQFSGWEGGELRGIEHARCRPATPAT